jgi:hypothetical protein
MGDLKVTADENRELTVAVMDESEVYGGFPQISKWVEIEPYCSAGSIKKDIWLFRKMKKVKSLTLLQTPWF